MNADLQVLRRIRCPLCSVEVMATTLSDHVIAHGAIEMTPHNFNALAHRVLTEIPLMVVTAQHQPSTSDEASVLHELNDLKRAFAQVSTAMQDSQARIEKQMASSTASTKFALSAQDERGSFASVKDRVAALEAAQTLANTHIKDQASKADAVQGRSPIFESPPDSPRNSSCSNPHTNPGTRVDRQGCIDSHQALGKYVKGAFVVPGPINYAHNDPGALVCVISRNSKIYPIFPGPGRQNRCSSSNLCSV